MKKLKSIKVKIFLLIFCSIAILTVALWVVMSNIIKDISDKNHINYSKQEFVQLQSSIASLQEELVQNSDVISSDTDVALIANLLDRYEDNENKHSSIFDEQKLKLAKILQRYKDISSSSDIFIYNSKKELLSFVSNQNSGYKSYKYDKNKNLRTFYFDTEKKVIDPSFSNIPKQFDLPLYFHSDNDTFYAVSITKIEHNNKIVGYVLNQIPVSQILFSQLDHENFCIALEYQSNLFISDKECDIDNKEILNAAEKKSELPNITTVENENLFIYRYTTEFKKIALLYITSKDEYFQTLFSMQKQLFVLILLITIAIALISYIFTQKIFITPFKKFYDGFLELQKGNFRYNISIDNEDELKILADAFNTMSDKIDNFDKEKTKNYEEVILALVDIIEQRDTYTAGHSKRVASYCELIAKAMGLADATIQKLKKAAMLHDIGKIQTPDSILLKPAKLNDLEYKLIQEHVSISNEILEKLTMYQDLAAIVKYHHERYDGKGYPYGLSKDEIPLLARIMIVADAFDAMTTNRIYKPRLSIQDAIEELEKNSGTQFDPQIVSIAKDALKDIKMIQTGDQLPHTEIEKERFAYFFKDKLTQSYNTDYLSIILNKDEFKDSIAYIINLRNFSNYNKEYGWDAGDKYLISLSHYITHQYPTSLLFRIEGDDFVLISEKFDKEDLKDFDNEVVTLEIVTISLNNINNLSQLKELLH